MSACIRYSCPRMTLDSPRLTMRLPVEGDADRTRGAVESRRVAGDRTRLDHRAITLATRLRERATRAALDWTWQHVDTDKVISMIQPDNVPSLQLAAAIGLTFEKTTTAYDKEVQVYSISRP